MKRIRGIVSALCIVMVLALAMPAAVYADDGPQGGSNSTKNAPPPPPPSSGVAGVLGLVISMLLG